MTISNPTHWVSLNKIPGIMVDIADFRNRKHAIEPFLTHFINSKLN